MDDYEITGKIGKGSSGEVFLAKCTSLKKIVAIKKIEIDESKKSRTKKAVTREASILQRLKHPYIVACHKWFLENNTTMHIVLDYCNGGTLHDKIVTASRKKQYFPEHKILLWTSKITSAVSYLHDKRILHRDLKAENVFLTKGDNPKLGDFGISKEINHTLDQAQTCVGTPCYLSPELCQDIPYNSKSDVWALGCLLFEITALAPAFDAANLISLFYKIIKCNYGTLPEHASQRIVDLIAVILQADPAKRPTATQLLCHESFTDCIDEVKNVLRESGVKFPMAIFRDANHNSVKSKIQVVDKLPNIEKNSHIDRNDSDYDWNAIINHDTSDTLVGSDGSASRLTPINTVPKLHMKQNPVSQSMPTQRSNSVFETPRDHKVFASLNLANDGKDEETDRPQTCPQSAVSRYDEFQHGDSLNNSGRRFSISSDDYSSDNDFDNGILTNRSYKSDEFSYKCLSSPSSDEEIVEDIKFDTLNLDEDIPEMIVKQEIPSLDGVKVLPGSAWLRNKRAQVLALKPESISENPSKNAAAKKYRLPGSSWLSEQERKERKKVYSEKKTIVLGESGGDVNGVVRNLPGSGWLSDNKSSSKSNKNKTPLKREPSMYIESASENSSPEKSISYSSGEIEYADDFEDYEDDFEPSDESDEEETSRPPMIKSSSIEVVRRSCKDIIGSGTFKEISEMFRQGASVSQVGHKFKIDRETLETLSMLEK